MRCKLSHLMEPCGGVGRFTVSSASNPAGLANYSHARLELPNLFRTLYISGTSCRCPDGSFDGAKTNPDGSITFNIEEQTATVLGNIEAVIRDATDDRGGLENIVDTTVFLVDMQRHYPGMNSVWNRTWPDIIKAPARTAIGVKELPSPKMIVEMKCIATVEIAK